MVELALLLWVMAFFFSYVGFERGWSKEVISTSGIILGLFALHQFDALIRDTLLAGMTAEQKFYGQAVIFLSIVFFAYQTRALVGSDASRRGQGRDPLQSKVLGGIVGFINGYLIVGTIWYFLDINRTQGNNYPLAPYVIAPPPGTISSGTVGNLPLYVLAQGPGSNGDLLALAVIILFIVVLMVI